MKKKRIHTEQYRVAVSIVPKPEARTEKRFTRPLCTRNVPRIRGKRLVRLVDPFLYIDPFDIR